MHKHWIVVLLALGGALAQAAPTRVVFDPPEPNRSWR
jgi:hypothetical protein